MTDSLNGLNSLPRKSFRLFHSVSFSGKLDQNPTILIANNVIVRAAIVAVGKQ